MTRQRSLGTKFSILTSSIFFLAVLIVPVAFAAPIQQVGTGQSAAKSSAASAPATASAQASNSALPGGEGATHFLARPSQTKRRDAHVMTPDNPLSFLPPVTYYPGGCFPISVAIADVNGDGKPDVVVANSNQSSCGDTANGGIGVLLGNGDGTFQQALTYASGGKTAASVAVADFNGDGKPDVVVANEYSNTVGVLLGNGDGTFQAAVTYGTGGSEPIWVAVADVNGDGKPDLLVANETGTGQVGVLLGNGDGTFQPALTTSGPYGVDSVEVGDVNGDGKLDLVVTHGYTFSAVGVFLGNGDGTFQPEVTYDTGGSGPWSAVVADVSGDGKPDLLVANTRSYDVGVLLGNGDGTFQAAVVYSSVGLAYGMAVADVNGDGKPDLMVNTYTFVSVLPGNGDGTFQPATTYGDASFGPGSVAVADLNGDGFPDLVVVNQYQVSSTGLVSVLLNSSGPILPTTTTLSSSLDPSAYGQSVAFTAHVTANSGIPTGTVSLLDGSTQVGSGTLANGSTSISISSLAAGAHSITAAYQGGLGFAPSTSTPLSQTVTMATTTTNVASSLNPAGTGQLVTFTATVTSQFGGAATGSVVLFSGSQSLGTASLSGNQATLTTSFAAVGTYSISAKYNGDSNNAGSTSSILGEVIIVAPPLRFQPAVTYGTGSNFDDPQSVAVGDMNGDGKPDLVVANSNSNTVGILTGNGNGTFQTALTYDSGGQFPSSVAVADLLTPPGQREVIVANGCADSSACSGSGESGVAVLFAFGNPKAVTYKSGGTFARSVVVADVSNDGIPDVLVAHVCNTTSDAKCSTTTQGSVGVLLGHDDIFSLMKDYNSGGYQTTSLAVADVNGDGQPDLVVANPCATSPICTNGSVGVLLGQFGGTFQKVVTYPAGNFPQAVAVADVNGDGKPDLIVADSGSNTVGVMLGKGDGTFASIVGYASGGASPASVAVADLNGDGKPDVLVGNYDSNTVSVLLGNGDGTFQPPLVYASGGINPISVAIADLNGDGKPDLVVANFGSNNIGVLLNSSGVHGSTSTSLASSLNPSIYGQAVTWTATVTTSGSVPPTGTVNFKWGRNSSFGTAKLNSSGVATVTKSLENADTYPLTAVYLGDTNNLGSTSTVLNQVITQATSSATLTSSPNPSTQGQAVTFTATITSPTCKPTGPVTFTAGKTVLGTAQLANNKAKFTISTLAVGSTTVTATYYGNSNVSSSSASVVQTVH